MIVALMLSAPLRSAVKRDGDIIDGGETLKVKVKTAKNDQTGEGRSTFVEIAKISKRESSGTST